MLKEFQEDLEYGLQDVEAIYHSTSPKWTVKRKIDTLLRIAASIIAQTGTDSSILEVEEARRIDNEIYDYVLELEKSVVRE